MKLIKNKSYHNKRGTRLYRIFENMLARCYRPSNKSYKYCDAKGITICDEWLKNKSKFFEWAENNGYNENLTIVGFRLGLLNQRIDWLGWSIEKALTTPVKRRKQNG